MANGSNTSSEGGIDYGNLISSGLQLIGVGISAASQSATECGKKCRAECKATTGAIFGGRNKCKKACKAQCLRDLNQPPEKQINITTIIIGIIIVLAIIGIVWWIMKKK